MQDTEFTVEEGHLFMLQTRSAKRPAQAAVRFAVDAVGEELLSRGGGADDHRRRRLEALLHPTFDPRAPSYDGARQGRERLTRRRRRARSCSPRAEAVAAAEPTAAT